MRSRELIHLLPYLKIPNLLRWFLFLPPIFFFTFCHSQTPISGVVNTYYSVTEVIPAQACLRLNTTAGLNYNDKVIIVQMKGASINTSNSSSFGDTTNLNNAGNYEIATVCSTNGDSLFLVYTLLNQYTVSGKVQVVKIPQYVSANVVDTLKATPWNNTTGRGGVIAIIVENDLTLNAPIYADSSGFRGGEYRLSNGTCSNFFPANSYIYDANSLAPQDGSFKGEGVVDVTAAQSGGRGAPANGGGGGNNHNNGGGGGANLSAGGIGGGNSSSVGCRTNIQGLGGKALSNYSGSKIFFGGGGGAGHSNFNFPNPTGGGNGGGIIFIQADNIIGNGRKIAANGRVGGASLGDGASGGGAGGTIIMDVNTYTGSLTIEANGGQGGTTNDGGNVGRCYGAGGGGSGGAIYFSGATPAVTVTTNAGAAGPEIGREASCNPIIPSGAGNLGSITPTYNFSASSIISTNSCGLLLPLDLVWFKAKHINEQAVLSWQVAEPESVDRFIIERAGNNNDWIAIDEQAASDGISVYQASDPFPQTHHNFYRIKIIGKNNEVSYSAVQKIFIPSLSDVITIYPNPAKNKITVSSPVSFNALCLFDLNGKLIWQKKNAAAQNNIEIDLGKIPAGVYVLKVRDVMKKVVVR